MARNHIIEREEWKRLENRPIFSRISTVSGRVVGNGFGQGNKNTNSTLTNIIDLDDMIEPKKNRLSYPDVTGKRVIDKDLDFPELRPNFRLATNTNRHSFSKDEITLESETGTSQSNDRAIINDILKKRVVAEVTKKLREEVRVDILRIIREEVRENLKIIIKESIRSELKIALEESRASTFRNLIRETVKEDIRERMLGSQEESVYESESETSKRSTNKKNDS